jgi:hypothetical protein
MSAFLLTLILLLFSDLSAQNQSLRNVLEIKISLQANEEPVKNVLSEISQMYKVEFSYSSNIIDVSRKISFNADNQPLGQLLLEMFDGLPVSISMIKERVVFQKQKEPLFQTVKGRVIDIGSKTPVVGALVMIPDHHSFVTVTNEEGFLRLKKSQLEGSDYISRMLVMNHCTLILFWLFPERKIAIL